MYVKYIPNFKDSVNAGYFFFTEVLKLVMKATLMVFEKSQLLIEDDLDRKK